MVVMVSDEVSHSFSAIRHMGESEIASGFCESEQDLSSRLNCLLKFDGAGSKVRAF